MRYLSVICIALLCSASVVMAEGLLGDMPAAEEFKERVPLEEPPVPVVEECGWAYRLSGGAPVHFFDDEDEYVMGGVYFDAMPCETPINLRMGFEVRHIDLEQRGSEAYAEFPGKDTEITYIRIPFSFEYVMPLADEWDLNLGLGPDIINTANDLSDTTVGFHLSGRLSYEIDRHWNLAVEGGYQWAEVDDGGPDMNLDGAFVTPTIGYKF